jgi:putative two-component system response regulator
VNAVAFDELDALEKALDDPSHAGLEAAIRHVSEVARRHHETTSPSSAAFMVRMGDLVRRVPGIEYPGERIDALLSAAHYFYLVGSSLVGLAYAMEAVRLARRSGHSLLRKALNYQGMIDTDTGNIPRAVECHAEALDLARSQSDSYGEMSVWINLGVTLLCTAQYRDSLAVLEHVVLLADASGTGEILAQHASANIALCCIHVGEIDRGLEAVARSLRGLGEPASEAEVISRVLREEYNARLLLEAGRPDEAAEHAAIALRYAAQSGSSRAQIAAGMTQGLCDVYAGRAKAGIELLTQMAERSRRELPIMLRDVLAIQVKAHEFLGMPREALVYHQELLEWLRRWHHNNALEHVRLQLEPLEAESGRDSNFSSQIRNQEAKLRGKVAEQETFRSPLEMLERLAVTAELREDSTGEHCYRLGTLAALLAHEAGSDAETCERIERAARLHDIGKNAIPDAIILKRGKLTDAERGIMRAHSAVGADLLAQSNIPHMEMAEQIARHHHDWWDGSKGELRVAEDIPFAARIVAIADVFDALTHERPHRGAWSIHEALDEISRLKGTQFDPKLAELFAGMIARLRREHRDLDAFLGEAAKSSLFLQARSRIQDALQDSQ